MLRHHMVTVVAVKLEGWQRKGWCNDGGREHKLEDNFNQNNFIARKKEKKNIEVYYCILNGTTWI